MANDRAQLYLDVVAVMVIALRRDGTVELINRNGCVALGRDEADIVGRNWFEEFAPPAHRADMWRAFDDVMRGDTPITPEDSIFQAITTRGVRTFSWNATLIVEDGATVGMLISGKDVTDQLRLTAEEQRVESRLLAGQRFESLGLLASGIAHDFNNLLLAIRGHAELVSTDPGLCDESRDGVRSIRDATNIAAGLVRQLLDFAGSGPRQVADVDLAAHASSMISLLRAALPKSVSVALETPPVLPQVRVDPDQVQQLMMNLVINAAEAYGGRPGQVTVRIDHLVLDQPHPGDLHPPEPLPPGAYLRLAIIDTGAGMDAATRARIFDPFFTTKAHGRGLGLAAALGIVRSSGAHIELTTAPGEGTRFDVWFPVVIVAGTVRPQRVSSLPPTRIPAPATVTLLVVDDEPLVRRFTVRVLERAGYRVLVAGGGAEAEGLHAEHPDIALVVLDVNMPEMDGREVAERLRQRVPGLPVVFQSGLPIEDVDDRSLFLSKPYTQNALLAAVGTLLGTSAA